MAAKLVPPQLERLDEQDREAATLPPQTKPSYSRETIPAKG